MFFFQEIRRQLDCVSLCTVLLPFVASPLFACPRLLIDPWLQSSVCQHHVITKRSEIPKSSFREHAALIIYQNPIMAPQNGPAFSPGFKKAGPRPKTAHTVGKHPMSVSAGTADIVHVTGTDGFSLCVREPVMHDGK